MKPETSEYQMSWCHDVMMSWCHDVMMSWHMWQLWESENWTDFFHAPSGFPEQKLPTDNWCLDAVQLFGTLVCLNVSYMSYDKPYIQYIRILLYSSKGLLFSFSCCLDIVKSAESTWCKNCRGWLLAEFFLHRPLEVLLAALARIGHVVSVALAIPEPSAAWNWSAGSLNASLLSTRETGVMMWWTKNS